MTAISVTKHLARVIALATVPLFTAVLTAATYDITGTEVNNGVDSVPPGSSVEVHSGAEFDNGATGSFNNGGAVINDAGGVISNAGNLASSGQLDNSGAFTNTATGSVVSLGSVTNEAGATFDNAGSIQNAGTFFNHGLLTNQAGASVNLSGGSFDNRGVVLTGDSGLSGAGVHWMNAGTLSATSGAALVLSGASTLELWAGSSISGMVSASGGGNVLVLSGTANASFDASTIGVQYLGFDGFQKAGSSAWALSGSCGALTPWTVKGGSLVVASDAALGNVAGQLTLDGGSLVAGGDFLSTRDVVLAAGSGGIDTQGQSVVLTGTVSGPGALTKTGVGTLVLDGANSYSGGTTVLEGTLQVGLATMGASSAGILGDVQLSSGAVLSGYGSVAGNVNNLLGGTVAPAAAGAGVGTLNVGGNYTQGVGSRMLIRVSPAGASQLKVGGHASLDGVLALVYAPGVYSAASYAIVSATGGVSGVFASVDGAAPAGWAQSLSYTPDMVLLGLKPQTVSPDGASVYAALDNIALRGGLDTQGLLLERLDGLSWGLGADGAELPDGAPLGPGQSGAWLKAVGSKSSVGGAGPLPGYDSQAGGVMFGWDQRWGKDAMLGLACGVGYGSVSLADGESGTLDSPRMAVYGAQALGAWRVDGGLSYAHDRLSTSRPISSIGQTASAAYRANEVSAALQAGRPFVWGGVSLLPSAGLRYVRLFAEDATESGADAFDLAVEGKDRESLQPALGLSAAKGYALGGWTLSPNVALGWGCEALGVDPTRSVSVGGGNFSVDGLAPARGQVNVGAGAAARLNDRVALTADYRAFLTGNAFSQQSLAAGLRYQFGAPARKAL